MWIAYVDESAADERIYMSIAGLLCPVSSVGALVSAMDLIVAKAAADHGTSPDAEVHVQDLLSRTNGWDQLKDTDSAVTIITSVVDALNSIPDIQYVVRGVDVVAKN